MWSEEEKKIIAENFGKKKTAEIAYMLHKSPDSVNYMAGRLGLAKTKRPWSDDELAYLRNYAGEVPNPCFIMASQTSISL